MAMVEHNQWLLFGLGFNGSGQLNPPESFAGDGRTIKSKKCESLQAVGDLGGSKEQGSDESPLAIAGLHQPHARVDVVMAVDTPKEVLRFSSKPLLTMSMAWDAVHIHAKCDSNKDDNQVCTITNGRWEKFIDGTKEYLPKDSSVVKVTETNQYIILQTESQTVVLDPQHKLTHLSDLRPTTCFSSLSNGSMYALLTNGHFHEVNFTSSDQGADKSPPLLSLGARLNTGVPVTQVSCGSSYTLLLTQTGRVFSFGLNDRGQLGHGDIIQRTDPTVIEALDGIAVKEIACGHWHSAALSVYGDVYTWGWNEHKQLGHSTRTSTIATPTLIEADEAINFTMVACGARHSIAVSDTHVMYVWGWNGYGQLGKSDGAVVDVPSEFSGFEEEHRVTVESVYCGHWCTFVLVRKS